MPQITFETPLADIKGISAYFLARFKKLGITTAGALLRHFPYRYEDFSHTTPIAELIPGNAYTIRAVVEKVDIRKVWRRRMTITEARVADESGKLKIVWFNQSYVGKSLIPGKQFNFSGKLLEKSGSKYFSNPLYEVANNERETRHTGRLVPIYPQTRGLTSKGIRFILQPILETVHTEDPLPPAIRETEKLLPLAHALQDIHFPATQDDAKTANRRFAFEDLFLLSLRIMEERMKVRRTKAETLNISVPEIKALLPLIPFELMESQKKSLWEIVEDINKEHPMNRLLQGDVGSGKTIVVALAAALVAQKDRQTAFLAPTEILARQHYLGLIKLFGDTNIPIALLTASEAKVFYGNDLETAMKKDALKREIKSGKIKIVVGTHALFGKGINFHALRLVIIDEQHRFGIKQRSTLLHGTETEPTQNKTEEKLLFEELTYKIRSALFNVKKELGGGHKEIVYQKAVAIELEKEGLEFSREKHIPIKYLGEKVGVYVPDFVVENKILLELKSLPFISATEKKQIWTYLKGSIYELALLANFGPKELTIERIIYNNTRKSVSVPPDSVFVPHYLSMSATPIPRTLALTVFGDLDMSLITELPKNRKPIITKFIQKENRENAYKKIREEIKTGRQAFVICPRIEPNPEEILSREEIERAEIKTVTEEFEKLSKKIFPDLRVAMLHGKMPAKGGSASGGKETKEKVMQDFFNHKTDILIATSVIEVGVDVPNATIMMIENADRFGVAQLYQFRGRVGRGAHQSYCFLFSETETIKAGKRLEFIERAKNGFELAEYDLKTRGPGEFFGTEQSGLPDLAMKAIQNPDLVLTTKKYAEEILKSDPGLLKYPILKKRLEDFAKLIHRE